MSSSSPFDKIQTTGNITVNAGAGNFTLSSGSSSIGSQLLSTGTITITANNLVWDSTAQVGGTGTGTGSANTVIIQPTSNTTIGLVGGSGILQIVSGSLSIVHAANVQIGNSASGLMTIGNGTTWTPPSTFATSSLTLDAVGITQTASNPVNLQTSGTGTLTMDAFTGTLTLNSSLLVGNSGGTTGTINLIADSMAFNAGTQVGGTGAGTGFAQYTIVRPYTNTQVINLAGGSSGLILSSSMASGIRSTNLRIGSSANTGGIVIAGAWTPGTNFNGGSLTLDTGGSITESAALTLVGSGLPNLIARDSNGVTLTNSSNAFGNIAVNNTTGTTQITSNNALAIASLTDDLGTVSGINTPGNNVTLISTGAISESSVINAALLTTTSVGSTLLDNSNTITSFNATNTSSTGNVSLTNTASLLTITGISQSGGNNIAINNTGGVTVTGAVSAGAGSINFAAGGSTSDITINANVSAGSTTSYFTAGRSIILNAGNIDVSQPMSGNINLRALTGSITEAGAGFLKGTLLTTHSVTGTTLTASNDVSSFNATNTTSGNISLTNSAIAITGISQTGGGNITITSSGAISQSGAITGSGSLLTTSSVGGGYFNR